MKHEPKYVEKDKILKLLKVINEIIASINSIHKLSEPIIRIYTVMGFKIIETGSLLYKTP